MNAVPEEEQPRIRALQVTGVSFTMAPQSGFDGNFLPMFIRMRMAPACTTAWPMAAFSIPANLNPTIFVRFKF